MLLMGIFFAFFNVVGRGVATVLGWAHMAFTNLLVVIYAMVVSSKNATELAFLRKSARARAPTHRLQRLRTMLFMVICFKQFDVVDAVGPNRYMRDLMGYCRHRAIRLGAPHMTFVNFFVVIHTIVMLYKPLRNGIFPIGGRAPALYRDNFVSALTVVTGLSRVVVARLVIVFTGNVAGRSFVNAVQTKIAKFRELIGENKIQEIILESPYNR
jgi:hypothetical protein